MSVTLSKYRRITGVLLIFVIAILTGFTIGKMYVDNIDPMSVVSADESSLRESEDTVSKWVEEAKGGKKATSFSAVELYNIAEYNLYQADKYYKLMTGKVVAKAPVIGDVVQDMRSVKIFNENIFMADKLSPGFQPICTRVIVGADNDIRINSKGSFVDGAENITGSFDSNKFEKVSLDKYKEIFNSDPHNVMPYIISNTICSNSETFSDVVDNGDGTFSFSFTLSGDYLALSALCYSYEIKFSSGAVGVPTWKSLTMNVTIDSSFNFKTITYDEVYVVKVPIAGGISSTVIDSFEDNFYFGDEVPEIPNEVKEIL